MTAQKPVRVVERQDHSDIKILATYQVNVDEVLRWILRLLLHRLRVVPEVVFVFVLFFVRRIGRRLQVTLQFDLRTPKFNILPI